MVVGVTVIVAVGFDGVAGLEPEPEPEVEPEPEPEVEPEPELEPEAVPEELWLPQLVIMGTVARSDTMTIAR